MYKRILLAMDDSDIFFESGYFDPHELVNKVVSHDRPQGVGGGPSPFRRSRYPLQCETGREPVTPGRIASTIVNEANTWKT